MTSDQPFVLCAGILVADLFVPPLAALPEQGQLSRHRRLPDGFGWLRREHLYDACPRGSQGEGSW